MQWGEPNAASIRSAKPAVRNCSAGCDGIRSVSRKKTKMQKLALSRAASTWPSTPSWQIKLGDQTFGTDIKTSVLPVIRAETPLPGCASLGPGNT